MKIAVLTPGMRSLPGAGKSIFPTGFLAIKIAEALVRRGHQVDVYASKDSSVKANLKSFGLSSCFDDKMREENPKSYLETVFKFTLFMASAVVRDSKRYDIIHAHDFRQLMYFSDFTQAPIVYTYHGSVEDDITSQIDIKRNKRFYKNNLFVAISKKQAERAKKYFNFIDVVYNGIEIDKAFFNDSPSGDILFVGRLMIRKGPDIAIKVSQVLNKPIDIIGEKHPPLADLIFYKKIFLPLTKSSNVNFLGFIPSPDIYKNYAKARVLLFPIKWEEPFGLVMIEAMACGTPVVAFNRGSVPEIIKDGETGFICPAGNIEAMVKAVRKIYEMPAEKYQAMRQACRKRVEANFTVEKMVDGYEEVYRKVIDDFKLKNPKS